MTLISCNIFGYNSRQHKTPADRAGVCVVWRWRTVHALMPSLFLSGNDTLLLQLWEHVPWEGRGGWGNFIKLTAASVLLRRAENS